MFAVYPSFTFASTGKRGLFGDSTPKRWGYHDPLKTNLILGVEEVGVARERNARRVVVVAGIEVGVADYQIVSRVDRDRRKKIDLVSKVLGYSGVASVVGCHHDTVRCRGLVQEEIVIPD